MPQTQATLIHAALKGPSQHNCVLLSSLSAHVFNIMVILTLACLKFYCESYSRMKFKISFIYFHALLQNGFRGISSAAF